MTTSTEIAKAEKSAAEMREEERRKRSNIDRLLLQNARLSPNEIAEKTGLPVDRAMARLHERLLIIEMGDLIDDMKARMQAAGDQFYGDIAAVTLRGYEAIGKRLEQRRRMNELDLAEITQAQGEMILAIFAETLHDQAQYLEELHPDSEWDIYDGIEAAFAYALPLAQERINKRVRE
jgi:hypothetical protein